MAFKHTIVWKKTEPANFASGEEAYQDKNRLFPPEVTAAVDAWHTAMINGGIMLQPLDLVWNQEDQTLNVVRIISNIDDYLASQTHDVEIIKQLCTDAGWLDLGGSMAIEL